MTAAAVNLSILDDDFDTLRTLECETEGEAGEAPRLRGAHIQA